MTANESFIDFKMREESFCMSSIFSDNDIGFFEGVQSSQCNVLKIPDRGCHNTHFSILNFHRLIMSFSSLFLQMSEKKKVFFMFEIF